MKPRCRICGGDFLLAPPHAPRVVCQSLSQMEQSLAVRELQIERKRFSIELRQNDRGRFLKITEEAHGRRNSVIIPSTGLDDFEKLLDEVLTEGEGFE